MINRLLLLAILSISAVAIAQDAPKPKTVWDGVYTEAQASRGAASFAASCARCHSSEPNAGEEGRNLAGKHFWEGYRESTVENLLSFVSKNMPNGQGGSLNENTYADLVAYILSKNELPAGTKELTKESAVGVQIIAKNGPGELPNGTLVRIVGCVAKRQGASGWILNTSTAPERPDPAKEADDKTRALGTRSIPLMYVLMSLEPYVGQRVRVRGLLMGEGGKDGINVSTTESLATTCP